MRESIGTVSLLNFIIFFIFLVFAFLMGTFSYYKAYRVNNAIVSSIEKYEGYNKYAESEINDKLQTLGYVEEDYTCGKTALKNTESNTKISRKGYCIYMNDKDNNPEYGENVKTDNYVSYEVTTIIRFQFPIIQDILKLRVSSRTHRIYDFETSRAAMK